MRNGEAPESTIEVGGRDMTVADIRRHLETLPTIEQAKGLLMGFYGIDADQAFAVLRRWSQTHNVRLATISAQLTRAAAAPGSSAPFGTIKELVDGLNETRS